mmetsp:Transcript_7554/g.10829  ORF Transcript_7554/g.10829 Transcript_7554/m.10829 type:complete len:125 (-) Transcript_7554:149-523(-)
MLNNYIDLLPKWGGYLRDKDRIHPDRFEHFLHDISAFEQEHFKRRGFEEDEKEWQISAENELDDSDFYGKHYGRKPTPKPADFAKRPLSLLDRPFAGATTKGTNANHDTKITTSMHVTPQWNED